MFNLFLDISTVPKDKKQLLELKNKDFIFKCLEILIDKNRESDIIKLTDPDFCKRNFDMNFAILQEVSMYGEISENDFKDSSFNRRYYPQQIVAFNKRYIVCNDWYYKNKVNPRDTRTNFVDWVLR